MYEKGPEDSLSEFFRSGKMDNDFVVENQYVTGVCVMYPERSAQEHEYMIREKSVVEIDARGLSPCVQEAKDLAFQAAVSRLAGGPSLFSGAAPAAPVIQPPLVPQTAAGIAPEPVDDPQPDEDDMPGIEEEPTKPAEPDGESWPPDEDGFAGTVQQFDLGGLRPASSLIPDTPGQRNSGAPAPDAGESAYEKARNMKITILGKLHECNNWSAGRILDEKPDIIVEFAHRYNGPKTEERDALRALYTDALRRVNQAA